MVFPMIGKKVSNGWKTFSAPFPGPGGKTGERRLQPWSCQAKTLRFPRRGRAGSPCPPEPVMPKGGAGNVRTHFSTDSGRLASAPPMTFTCMSRFPAARGLAALPTRLCTNESTSSFPGISLGWSGLRDRVVACDEAGRQNKRGRFFAMACSGEGRASARPCAPILSRSGRAEARPSPGRAPGRVALPRDLVVGKQPRNCGKTQPPRRVRHRCAPHLAPALIPQVPRNPSGLGVLSIVSIRSCNQKTTILKIVLAWGWGVW